MKNALIILLAISSLCACSAFTSEQTTSQPLAEQQARPTNILWVYIEDQNAWNNAYGDYTVSTPTLAEFAKQGVVFETAIQPAAVCSATRSALITGKHQTTLGLHNHRSHRAIYNSHFLPEGYKTVPELFVEAGYKTFNIGKDDYNFAYDRSKLYNAHKGIAGFQGAHDGAKFDWAKKLKNQAFFGQIQLQGGKHNKFSGIAEVDPEKMQLPPYYPSSPAFKKEWAKHYRTQLKTDQELAEILQQLKDNDLYENTAVFVFSDHGMILLRHKQELYEGGLKVPLLVSWPQGNHLLRKKGAKRSELVSGLDIPATSLALAGIEIPDYYDGKNMFAKVYQGHEYVISAKDRMDFTFDRVRSVRSKNFSYIRNFYPEIPRSQTQYRTWKSFTIELKALFEQGKLTPVQADYFAPRRPAEELYDLMADPHQINNLAADPAYAEQLKIHRQVLLDWIAKTDDQGAYPESELAIKEVMDMWGKHCTYVGCEQFRQQHPQQINTPGEQLYPATQWPSYMQEPQTDYKQALHKIYRSKNQ